MGIAERRKRVSKEKDPGAMKASDDARAAGAGLPNPGVALPFLWRRMRGEPASRDRAPHRSSRSSRRPSSATRR